MCLRLSVYHVSGRRVDSMVGKKLTTFITIFWEYSLSSLTVISAVLIHCEEMRLQRGCYDMM